MQSQNESPNQKKGIPFNAKNFYKYLEESKPKSVLHRRSASVVYEN